MTNLNLADLVGQRKVLREKEAELTRRIKEERTRQAKNNTKQSRGVAHETYKKLVTENKRLRGLIGLLHRCNGETFKAVGLLLEVSEGRARTIVDAEMRFLMWEDGRHE